MTAMYLRFPHDFFEVKQHSVLPNTSLQFSQRIELYYKPVDAQSIADPDYMFLYSEITLNVFVFKG